MAAISGVLQIPNAHNVSQLLPKLYDADSDFRYMALSDLRNMLNIAPAQFIAHDYTLCAKTIDGLLHTLNDTNGDVQNMAIQCLGPFVNKISENIICPLFDKISTMQTENVVDNSIPALALRTLVISLPRPIPGIPRSKSVQDAYNAISKVLIPRLLGYCVFPPSERGLPSPPKGMLRVDIENGTDSNAIDVLIEIARCFGQMVAAAEVDALQKIIMEILDNERTASGMKKKAVVALAALSSHFSDNLLSSFVSRLIEALRDPHLTHGKRKLSIALLGSLARTVPSKFGRYLKTLAPFALSPLGQSELDEQLEAAAEDEEKDPEVEEVREAALVAIEGFLAFCSQDMRPFTSDVIDATARYLKYDPNVADDEDMDEEEEEDALEGEDFEEEQGFDDDDDVSWKLRRCAAKVFHTLISTRSPGDLLDDGTLYKQVAPALVARFKEREESVRLEVISTLSLLVRNTRTERSPQTFAAGSAVSGSMGPPLSRKRRRAGSDASMLDSGSSFLVSNGITPRSSSPLSGPQTSLAKLSPDILRAVSQLLKNSPVATQEASVSLLKNLILALRGGLAQYLSQIIDPVVDAIKTGSGGAVGTSLASANSYRIQALQFAGALAEGHTAQELQPYLGKLIPAIISSSQEKYGKVSVEGLAAVERFIEALTPPRSHSQQNSAELGKIFEAVIGRISTTNTDLEVRQESIRALGLLLSRTSGSQAGFSLEKRLEGLDLLLQRLQNELTRLSSVRAIDAVAASAQSKSEFKPQWVQTAALELGAQLRKASRSLRGASLNALKTIVLNPSSAASLDSKTVQELIQLLLPIISSADLHLLGPALLILAELAKIDPQPVVKKEVVDEICNLLRTTLLGSTTLESLLTLVKTVGSHGQGSALMGPLLKDVGIGGNADVVGKVVGTLLVAGAASGGDVGVKLDDFVNELNTAKDEKRKCLALSVLGEAGMQLGGNSPLKPDLFIRFFHDPSEKVPLTAAIALGRAGAGDIATFLPVLLSSMSQASDTQYLLLHSLKEILQHDGAESEIIPHTQGLWQNVIAASRVEDNRAVGAECIGRLAIIDPKTYLPQLKTFLSDRDSSIRAMVISALRYTFADTDETYDEFLRPVVIDMLKIMLNEQDLENRRLALITLNSATHNKPELILPHLDEFLPLVMNETVIKPELVREVSMGPFKHKVDDGLEIRKSAYETLYVLLDTAFSRLNVPDLFDRVIAGVGDEHDIKVLCCLMLSKLVVLAPEETMNRLADLAEHFRSIIGHKPKENAVKQELEKLTEAQKGVFKVSIQINKSMAEKGTAGGAAGQEGRVALWNSYWDWASNENKGLKMVVEEELKEKER